MARRGGRRGPTSQATKNKISASLRRRAGKAGSVGLMGSRSPKADKTANYAKSKMRRLANVGGVTKQVPHFATGKKSRSPGIATSNNPTPGRFKAKAQSKANIIPRSHQMNRVGPDGAREVRASVKKTSTTRFRVKNAGRR